VVFLNINILSFEYLQWYRVIKHLFYHLAQGLSLKGLIIVSILFFFLNIILIIFKKSNRVFRFLLSKLCRLGL
jgi:hypothetical protein